MEAVQKINLKELCNRDPIKSSVSPKPDKRKRSKKQNISSFNDQKQKNLPI